MVTRLVLIVVAVFALTTCKIDVGQFGDRGCTTDSDCRPDQVCGGEGLCAQIQCTAPTDCGPGYQYDCQANLCIATACSGVDGECAIGYQCTEGFCAMECAGLDSDLDGICDTLDNCVAVANRNQADGDGDDKGDACDACATDPDNDADADTVCGDVDNCPVNANTNQLDRDSDGSGDECETDDDNDGVPDVADTSPLDPKVCVDADGDGCDDCAIGVDGFGPLADPSAANDGVDSDADGQCNVGDGDDDNDGVSDAQDLCALGEQGWVSGAATDADGDGCQDASEDTDDDNDGVGDLTDPSSTNNRICGDSDGDACDDCAVGIDGFGPLADRQPAADGLDSDADGACNAGDSDDDNDTVQDSSDTAPTNKFQCLDVDGDGCDDCAVTGGPPSTTNDGSDTDGDSQCNGSDLDDDNDGVADTTDVAPLDKFTCRDGDNDTCDDCAITGGPPATTNDGSDNDADGRCDQGDTDDDNDGVADGDDVDAANPKRCRDVDGDTCDDCAIGTDGFGAAADFNAFNDGADGDADGICNAGDTDDDNDTVADSFDLDPLNRNICRDLDDDGCDDCSNTGGPPSVINDGLDSDGDGKCNTGDPDDDNDTVADGTDSAPTDRFKCRDLDGDTCDDCAVTGGPPDPSTDGLDSDGDGTCNAGDPDDDSDTVIDTADSSPLDKFACRDLDSDGCDDCSVTGTPSPGNDGADSDGDGTCNGGDADDDNDSVADNADNNPIDRFKCRDVDGDTCDDCAVTGGPPSASNDGPDTDGDGICNSADGDDDNDGVSNAIDPFPLDPTKCGRDVDADTCDDCAIGVDGFGPQPDFNPNSDGTDTDGDGQCNAGDTDDDNDGVADGTDTNSLNRNICADSDGDTCDDCAVTGGPPSTANDGLDSDSDGRCNLGDPDDDNDTVTDGQDSNPLNRFACADIDSDSCDDCSIQGAPNVASDGIDTDSDGRCNASDSDDDADTVPDATDVAPLDRFRCRDQDLDACDDCSITGGPPDVANDGLDTDADGRCDAGDNDSDGDSVPNSTDTFPFDNTKCQDLDSDGCDDCAVTNGPPSTSNDGADADGDGQCNSGDADDDNDGVTDVEDPSPTDPRTCGRDLDADTCDDCAVGLDGFGPSPDFDVANDGLDTDGDGRCNAGDDDDDNDTIADGLDGDSLNKFRCRDTDVDTCDDCAVTGGPPSTSNDGLDTDSDGQCNAGDADDDNDTVLDSVDTNPINKFVCRDTDTDTCDDCAVTGGPPTASNDGTDTDGDGACDTGDGDDDDDTVADGQDGNPLDPFACRDVDVDSCDDCAITGGPPNTGNDGTDTDADGKCNPGDPDDDNDSVADAQDPNPLNRNVCGDTDTDTCDDCAVTGGPPTVGNDGLDTDVDGKCNAGDPDDDGDTVADVVDVDPLDRFKCRDTDTDACDDCAVTGGPPETTNDGADTDTDGVCNAGDNDDDNDTVLDLFDVDPLDKFRCSDGDSDTCDDCATTGGPPSASNDGTDTDTDGACNAGDSDDDNDTIADGADNSPLDRFRCRDVDVDSCDDCGVTGGPPSTSNDGTDTDAEGLCNVGDPDDDNDGVADGSDSASLNPDLCRDTDADTCDDCAVGTDNFGPLSDAVPTNDGTDSDSDGLCNAGDADDDNDGVIDAIDVDSLDRFACADTDTDTCDDCSVTGGPAAPANDGPDADGDGICDAGEPCNQEIVFIAAGAQVTASADGATLTPVIPTAQTGDFAIVVLAGRPEDNTTDPVAPTGWTKRTGSFLSVTGDDLKIVTYFKFLATGEPNPIFTLPATWTAGGGSAGASAQIAVWRGVDTRSPFDVSDATGTGASSSTFTPPGISTVTNGSWVVTAVASADDNNIALGTANGFASRMSGTSFDTGTGADHAIGVADFVRVIAGSTTMPSWSQGSNGPDPWVAITYALRPVTGKVCTGIVDLAGGGDHTCAIIDTGALRCWGRNDFGQLGRGNTTILGDNADELPTADINVGGAVSEVATGLDHTCARLTTGKVRCWGNGGSGRLGYGNTTTLGDAAGEMPPADVNLGNGGTNDAVDVAAGDQHSCALLQSGVVRCWGEGSSGRLGYGNNNDIGDASGEMPPAAVNLTVNGESVVQIVAGGAHTCALINPGGKVRCWGAGGNGRLGYGNTNNIGDGAGEMPPANVSLGGVAVVQLSAGGAHTCARLSTGAVRCWGVGAEGQIGTGNTSDIGDDELPSAIGVVDFGGVAAEVITGQNHSCVRLTTGLVRCWGRADTNFGQLGYGNNTKIGDDEAPSSAGDVSLLRAALRVYTGYNHTCALLDVGGVRCWGKNTSGQLGYGNTNNIGDNELPSSVGYVQIE